MASVLAGTRTGTTFKNEIMGKVEKRPIAETLRAMELGAVETFSLEQLNSINQAKGSTLAIDRANGKNWSVQRDIPNGVVKVTRTA